MGTLGRGVLVVAFLFKLAFVGFNVRSVRKYCVVYFCGTWSPSAWNFAWFITERFYVREYVNFWICVFIHKEEV